MWSSSERTSLFKVNKDNYVRRREDLKLCKCGYDVHKKNIRVWELKDTKDFIHRKIAIADCKCGNHLATLYQKRLSDNQVFVNEYDGVEAVKVIAREAKRLISESFYTPKQSLTGWIFGVNKEIKNKKGKVTQIRQYASSFNNSKELVKKIYTK